METKIKETEIIKSVYANTNQLLLEGDMIIPDSEPDAGILLLENADCYITESDIVKDRISYKGNLEVNILYSAKDTPEETGSLKNDVPFNDFSVISTDDNNITADVYCRITDTQFKIVNSRKINYRIICDIVSDIMQTETICPIEKTEGDDDISQLHKNAVIDRIVCCKNDRFYIKDSINTGSGRANIENIIYNNMYISSKEIKPLTDKISISGVLKIFTAYRTSSGENAIEYMENELPFNTMIDAQGCRSDYCADVRLTIENKFLNVTQDNDGEDRVIDIEISVGCHYRIMEKSEILILSDLYCIDKFIKTETESTSFYETDCRNLSICNVREIIKFDDNCPPVLNLIYSEIMPVLDNVTNDNGRFTADGAVNIQLFYAAKDDSKPYFCHNTVIPFTQKIEGAGTDASNEFYENTYISPESININMLSEKEAEVRCQICLDMHIFRKNTLEYIKKTEFIDMDKEILDKKPSIVIYTVQKGDSLWKIAKKYNTTIERIATLNNIENPDLIYPGDKLIITKNSGKYPK